MRGAGVRDPRAAPDRAGGRPVVARAGLARRFGGDLADALDELERSIRTSDPAPHEESPA